MPFNLHAEMSFTEMCGCRNFGICVRPQPSHDRHPRTVGI